MKKLCDSLTLFRLLVCLALIADGLILGSSGARLAVILLILGYTSDILDGRIARATHKPPTKIGNHEIIFDMLLAIGSVLYLGLAGLIPRAVAYPWTAWLLFLIIFFRSSVIFSIFKGTTVTITLPLLIFLSEDWLMLIVALLWGAFALLLNQKRAGERFISWKKIFQGIFGKFKKANE